MVGFLLLKIFSYSDQENDKTDIEWPAQVIEGISSSIYLLMHRTVFNFLSIFKKIFDFLIKIANILFARLSRMTDRNQSRRKESSSFFLKHIKDYKDNQKN